MKQIDQDAIELILEISQDTTGIKFGDPNNLSQLIVDQIREFSNEPEVRLQTAVDAIRSSGASIAATATLWLEIGIQLGRKNYTVYTTGE